MTKPIFVVSSGRSGSQLIEKLFSSIKTYDAHHEYLCTHVQSLAMQKYMNLKENKDIVNDLKLIYSQAVKFSKKKYFLDSSNKLSWLIDELSKVFDDAKFVYIYRDGRNVVSSFYNKLSQEMYDDYSVSTLIDFLESGKDSLRPPPEKKYWWPIPLDSRLDEFKLMSRFERVCFYWTEVNETILESLKNLKESSYISFDLNTLTTNYDIFSEFLEFLDVKPSKDLFNIIQKPHNIHIKKDFGLTEDQNKIFNLLCGRMMKKLGYSGSYSETKY